MMRAEAYDPIDDWSREGRWLLVETRGDEIRALLDLAFSGFIDDEPTGLSAFGFHGDDPVSQAVEWAIDRFLASDLDPGKLHPGSRSLRLFTEVRFWLSQKVGRQGYTRILAAASSPEALRVETIAAGEEQDNERSDTIHAAMAALGRKLSRTLSSLNSRTCADIVGFWLEGTKALRCRWFGWRDRGEISEGGMRLSKKQRSFYAHDAMFRFLCCFHDLVPIDSDALATRTLELTTLSPCENVPPYRVLDRDVAPRLVAFGVKGPREVARLRKEGACACVRRCLERAASGESESVGERLSGELTRRSLGPTTLHALGIEDDVALREQMDAVCKPMEDAS